MKPIRRILFAVRDPTATRQPGVEKAVGIARSFGASLELFHALSGPVFAGLEPITDETIDRLRERTEERTRMRLARLMTAARNQGVDAEYSVAWDHPPHEAVVRRATQADADLIIAECHKGARTRAWLLHLTDWELLRTSPLPVLLLKSPRPYRRPLTLAAVDPGHLHAKPLDLDTRIVEAAREFSKVMRGSLHLMHASNPPVSALALGDPGINASMLSMTYDDLQQQERDTFEKFAAGTGVPRARRHLTKGDPAIAIPRAARKLGAGLVVMGAVSRSGLKRVFIGNTAERILGTLPCDVLVVKPEAFRNRVAREARGMRVIPPRPSISA
ncbi:MAG TPA: universal stress protein [Steroidobacteraceae bacterium]|nr:universal stress protein [Steroidobacteraceae bacterium]